MPFLLVVLRYCLGRNVERRLLAAVKWLLAFGRLRVTSLPQGLTLQSVLPLSEDVHVEGEVKVDVVTRVAASRAI